jgi:cysteinyl-tRNA synthetase
MVTLIRQLIARGHAYEADGEVLFDVQSMPDYGLLSGRRLDEQKAGARVAVDAHKKNPADFVLWKLSSDNEPGWDSPWGRGRPGWHIECSAMSAAYLGEVFDIHGGGLDLIFPHHENEIAQSRCAHGTHTMANYWMHNGFLQVEGEKMSKSLGNFVTINELLTTEKFGRRKWPGEVLRLNMLRTHYRQPIDWTTKALEESETILRRICGRIKQFDYVRRGMAVKERSGQLNLSPEILEALVDDLNTPLMVSRVGELKYDGDFDQALLSIGIDVFSYARWLRSQEQQAGSNVDELVAARLEARKRKDFAESDRIRDELAAMGVVLKDGKDADGKPVTTWEIAR